MALTSAAVVVLGSSNTDLVVKCERLPTPGETVLGGSFAQHPGGKGANQAVAAARSGARVAFVGAHGADDFGRGAHAGLRKEGIDLRFFVEKKKASSGVALILVQKGSGENCIAVASSANDEVTASDVARAKVLFRPGNVLVCQGETPLPTVVAAARLARKQKMTVIYNPAPARPLPASFLKRVDVLIPNETEATLLTGKRKATEAAKALLQKGCRRVLVTLGSKGVLLQEEHKRMIFPAPRVKAIDTVGAGDCFVGWVASGLAKGLSFEETVKRAIRAAAISVTRVGAQSSMPLRREISRK